MLHVIAAIVSASIFLATSACTAWTLYSNRAAIIAALTYRR